MRNFIAQHKLLYMQSIRINWWYQIINLNIKILLFHCIIGALWIWKRNSNLTSTFQVTRRMFKYKSHERYWLIHCTKFERQRFGGFDCTLYIRMKSLSSVFGHCSLEGSVRNSLHATTSSVEAAKRRGIPCRATAILYPSAVVLQALPTIACWKCIHSHTWEI